MKNAAPKEGKPKPTRRTMRLIGYNLLTTALLLIPIELGLRFLDFESVLVQTRERWLASRAPAWSTVDPDLLWVPRDYRARVAVRDWPLSMVFMGDSCTHGKTYDEELRSIITARNPSSVFTFVNTGVGGWSSWSGLRQLQRDVLPLRPKAITIYYGWNDHWLHHGFPDKVAAPFTKEPPRLQIRRIIDKAVFTARQISDSDSAYRVSLADFRANLRQMVRIARDNDIVPILLTAPTSHRRGHEPAYLVDGGRLADLEDLVPLHRRYVEAVREVAAEEDALLVDLHREFDRLPRRDLDRLLVEDGIHQTREGDRKIAEIIDRHLVESGLYQQILLGGSEAEERFHELLDDARLLVRGRFDVWLEGGRLLYVREHCAGIEEPFSLHVVPADPDDLPEHRKEHGFDNLDFDISSNRLDFMPQCVAVRRLPDYPVSSIRTGQFEFVGENDFNQLWEEEFIFTEDPD